MAQDFVLAQLYWGSTFVPDPQHRTDPTVGPFNWIDMNGAIGALCGSRYFTRLDQYGAGRVMLGGPRVDVVGLDPPSEWRNGTQEDGFTDRDIADFIVREIDAGRIPRPTDWQEKPIYLVILPQGLFSKDHFLNAVGLHFHFDYQGTSAIGAWNMQGDSLQDTTQIVAHEIVEGIAAELGAGEIADDCTSTTGIVNGVMVQGYKSREDGDSCIIPGQLTVVVHQPPWVFHPGIVNA
jgi:hypothetical protein